MDWNSIIAAVLAAAGVIWAAVAYVPWRKLWAKVRPAAGLSDDDPVDVDDLSEIDVFISWLVTRDALIVAHDTEALRRHNDNLVALFKGKFDPPGDLTLPDPGGDE